jgi:hypothetical protein
MRWNGMRFPKEYEDPANGCKIESRARLRDSSSLCAYAVPFGSGRLADVNEP